MPAQKPVTYEWIFSVQILPAVWQTWLKFFFQGNAQFNCKLLRYFLRMGELFAKNHGTEGQQICSRSPQILYNVKWKLCRKIPKEPFMRGMSTSPVFYFWHKMFFCFRVLCYRSPNTILLLLVYVGRKPDHLCSYMLLWWLVWNQW